MSALLKRLKRYSIRESASVNLILNADKRDQLRVLNISPIGIACELNHKIEGLASDQVIPNTLIEFGLGDEPPTTEHIGRLYLRDIRNNLVIFSAIDKYPHIEGKLSRCLASETGEISANKYEIDPQHFSMATFIKTDDLNVDLMGKIRNFKIWWDEFIKTKSYQYSMIRSSSKTSHAHYRTEKNKSAKEYIVFGSNDYYGMSYHPKVIEAAKKAIDTYGVGSTGSFVLTGQTDLHEELSELLAKTCKKERCFLFTNGYDANVGAISSLILPNDLIVADMFCHASILDAIKLSRGESKLFRHNDPQNLDSILQRKRANHAGCLIITEGVFSMDADYCPLPEIVDLKTKHSARLFVDEAHSFGIVGPTGLGVCEKFDLYNEVDFLMGSLSKISGAVGGFVACDKDTYDWFKCFARSAMFTASMPPPIAAANIQALKLFLENREIVQETREKRQYFENLLVEAGFNIRPGNESLIVIVEVGDTERAGRMNEILLKSGIFATCVVYPAVPKDSSRFRFTISAGHSKSDLSLAVEVLKKAGKEVGMLRG